MMDRIGEILGTYRRAGREELRVESPVPQPYAAVDPAHLRVTLTAGAAAHVVVVHTTDDTSEIAVELAADARLELTELFTGAAFSAMTVRQEARSACRIMTLLLSGANVAYRLDLAGREAESVFGGAFLLGGSEHGVLKLRTSHLVGDCRSDSTVKGVAGGTATGEFHGEVYVARDAQHTDARQESRNVLLSEGARITTMPQLEIYADDVKCSHGATVGQMDADAIFYMRQRGLSESQARRLQIEGFVGDIARRCGEEPLGEALLALAAEKLERM